MPSPNSLNRASRPVRYVLAMAAGAVSALLTSSLPALHIVPFMLSFAAVMVTAWYVGFDGAVVCALTALALLDYYVLPPRFSFLADRIEYLRMGLFFGLSLLFAWLTTALLHHRERLATEGMSMRLAAAEARRDQALELEKTARALRHSEERLRLALESANAGLWDWDLETGELTWSAGHYRLYGFAPGEVTPSYALWTERIVAEDRQATLVLLEQAREQRQEFHAEFRVVWADGSVHWVDAQGRFQYDPEGQPTRMAGVVRDRTREKQAEQALLWSEKLAITGRLAASIAHEINNPLESVVNLLYLIRGAESLEEVQVHAQTAMSEIMRVSQITQQTLRFYRQADAAREVRMSELLDSVLVLSHARIVGARVRVDRQYGDDPAMECLDGDLRQIFANLIGNALDAMPEGGRLVLRVRHSRDWRERSGWGLRITIGDTGSGMDLATRRRIYEPFFTTKQERGTGLGMWVVAELVRRNSGDLRVWSGKLPGRSGTVFSLFVPGAVRENGARDTQASPGEPAGDAVQGGRVQGWLTAREPV